MALGEGRIIKPDSDTNSGIDANPVRLSKYRMMLHAQSNWGRKPQVERVIMPNKFRRETLS